MHIIRTMVSEASARVLLEGLEEGRGSAHTRVDRSQAADELGRRLNRVVVAQSE